jgi:hypothetical protein
VLTGDGPTGAILRGEGLPVGVAADFDDVVAD